jgi:transposase
MVTGYRLYEGPEPYTGQQYVGIDLHRRRSVIVRLTEAGERISAVRIDNDPVALGLEIEKAGPDPEVTLEATYGWYWAVDALAATGAEVHLGHPLGMKMLAHRRHKDDIRDSHDMADLLRMGRLPEAWIAPPQVRELRELVRHRAKLVALRSGLKAQVHAVLAKNGVNVTASDLFDVGGRKFLANLALPAAYAHRLCSLLGLIDHFEVEVANASTDIAATLATDRGYAAIQALPGVGPVLAAVLVAEIGDASRFAGPDKLCCWAGMTPRHRESDKVIHKGHISKQGSRLVRWAVVEAIQRKTTNKIAADRDRIEERRGKNIAKVAAARKLLTLVYYGLRDGHIRALAKDHG